MGNVLRRMWLQIRQWLYSDSVVPFVWVYYMWLFIFGICAVVVFQPAGAVIDELGKSTYTLWIWTCILGTGAVMGGLILRHGGTPIEDMTSLRLRGDWLGLWMQWGGHAAMFLVLLAFEIAGLSNDRQLRDPFILFAMAPYVQGCLILWITTSMKLLKAADL